MMSSVLLQQRFFQSSDIDAVMQLLIVEMERKLFPDGAPARPTVLLDDILVADSVTCTGQPLASNSFQVPPLHIPNGGDGANSRHSYKSELVLVRDPKIGTKKLLWWHDKDPREEAHNHPWNFRSGIIAGGYTEERFWVTNGKIHKERVRYESGMVNEVPADVFHNVVDVQPGTVTYMDCGPARQGNAWGYLDSTDGHYIPFEDLVVPGFKEAFTTLNTHTVKKSP